MRTLGPVPLMYYNNSILFIFFFAGMMIESMAGKSASINGVVYDATPFTYSEDDPAVDHFGNLLKQCTRLFVYLFQAYCFNIYSTS